jgi:hypothetical protein
MINTYMSKYLSCPICKESKYANNLKSHLLKHGLTEDEYWDVILNNQCQEILKLYVEQEVPKDTIAKKLKLTPDRIGGFLKYKNVKIRTISDTRKTKHYKTTYENTCVSNYGVTNPSKSETIKSKKADTFIKNYGYVNNFCNNDIRKSAASKITSDIRKDANIKSRETLQQKYGVDNPTKIESVKDKLREAWSKRKKNWSDDGSFIQEQSMIWKKCKFVSKIERRVQDIVFKKFNNTLFNKWVCGYNIDIIINNFILIEIHGDYWHANPSLYEKDHILYHTKDKNPVRAIDIWEKDGIKRQKLKESGLINHIIWENDIKKLNDLELETYIETFINEILENNKHL